ncbi:hypothetical protein BDZ89DRAFT_1124585 [Hymenopellis radicata]|nr:hypothetical protein BDZ89DRAFT_1124585 [Hymenopellis radicata]
MKESKSNGVCIDAYKSSGSSDGLVQGDMYRGVGERRSWCRVVSVEMSETGLGYNVANPIFGRAWIRSMSHDRLWRAAYQRVSSGDDNSLVAAARALLAGRGTSTLASATANVCLGIVLVYSFPAVSTRRELARFCKESVLAWRAWGRRRRRKWCDRENGSGCQ